MSEPASESMPLRLRAALFPDGPAERSEAVR
jgi:hypothetical protein